MSTEKKSIKVHFTFRNLESSDPLKTYGTEKITHCIQKFVHHDTDAHVTFKVEKMRQVAELNFHADGADFIASEESEDMYKSIDTLIDTITQQLRKHKSKLTSHHA